MKKFKRISLFLLLMVLTLSLIGCVQKKQVDEELKVEDVQELEEVVSDYPMEIEDNFGNKETIEE